LGGKARRHEKPGKIPSKNDFLLDKQHKGDVDRERLPLTFTLWHVSASFSPTETEVTEAGK